MGKDGICYGPLAWDKDNAAPKRAVKHIRICPWVGKVREWFKREMSTGRIKRDW